MSYQQPPPPSTYNVNGVNGSAGNNYAEAESEDVQEKKIYLLNQITNLLNDLSGRSASALDEVSELIASNEGTHKTAANPSGNAKLTSLLLAKKDSGKRHSDSDSIDTIKRQLDQMSISNFKSHTMLCGNCYGDLIIIWGATKLGGISVSCSFCFYVVFFLFSSSTCFILSSKIYTFFNMLFLLFLLLLLSLKLKCDIPSETYSYLFRFIEKKTPNNKRRYLFILFLFVVDDDDVCFYSKSFWFFSSLFSLHVFFSYFSLNRCIIKLFQGFISMRANIFANISQKGLTTFNKEFIKIRTRFNVKKIVCGLFLNVTLYSTCRHIIHPPCFSSKRLLKCV